ncbi:relaxase/mobilization nuclease domain-containing protein [Pseudocnuella soli]|uniref:relaxase/mobilization nuclease domain-containing protein n=1 Tax=Pseudocnuella soli TaxID=2502779 RepID=UPI00104AAAFB|nr:relaxase/mobilization nuclease domain-containing protein [Pseudocnuella soli]
MIGKVRVGKSFRGCLMYCLHDKPLKAAGLKNRAEVLLYHKCFGTDKELVQQFSEVRLLNEKVSKPVLHVILSLAPGEELARDKWVELARGCATAMGFQHNQYVAILHRDTAHQHLHLVANRIGFDGRAASDSNNYKKVAAFCRQAEAQYGLKKVHSPKRFLPKEQQVIPRVDRRKESLKAHIGQALTGSSSLMQFEVKMKALGYVIFLGRGIAFLDSTGVRVKGSEVGYPLKGIERMMLQQQQALQLHNKEDKQEDASVGKSASKEMGKGMQAQMAHSGDPMKGKQEDRMQKGLEPLLNPVQGHEASHASLLQKKRKKQKRSPRL